MTAGVRDFDGVVAKDRPKKSGSNGMHDLVKVAGKTWTRDAQDKFGMKGGVHPAVAYRAETEWMV